MKVSNWIFSKDNKFTIWLIWGIFTILIIIIASQHEPWYDEYHVWAMCKHKKITWLWSSMMGEGHFILWHLLIYPFVKLGCSFWCLQFVGVSLTSAAVWVLLMKAPFDIISKSLVTFCYPIMYLFPVISRCYALIPLLLFTTAWLYTIQQKHLYLYCFFVGLIAHTHAYMEGLVGALFFLFCYEQIYIPYKKNENTIKAIKAASITIGVVLLAYLQVSESLQYAKDNLIEKNNNLKEIFESIFLFTTSNNLFIIPGNWHQLFPNYLTSSHFFQLILFALWIVVLINFIAIFIRYEKNRKFILPYLAAIVWQVYFALTIYGFGHQRIFLPPLILIFFLWISYHFKLRKAVLITIVCLFFLTAGHKNIIKDIEDYYCEETVLQEYVEKNIPHGENLLFTSYYLKRGEEDLYYNYNIHFMQDSWDVKSPETISKNDLEKIYDECGQANTIYMFTDKMYPKNIGLYQLTMLTNIGKYYIYKTIRLSNYSQERNKPIER
jgi:hypothetical protein